MTPLGGGLGIDPPAPVPGGDVVPVGAGAAGPGEDRGPGVPRPPDPAGRRRPRWRTRPTWPATWPTRWSRATVPGGGGLAGRRPPSAGRRGRAEPIGPSGLARWAPDSGCCSPAAPGGSPPRWRWRWPGRRAAAWSWWGAPPCPRATRTRRWPAAGDRGELRRALIATGMREPRAIEAECDRLLAEREVRATMSALAEAGPTCATTGSTSPTPPPWPRRCVRPTRPTAGWTAWSTGRACSTTT